MSSAFTEQFARLVRKHLEEGTLNVSDPVLNPMATLAQRMQEQAMQKAFNPLEARDPKGQWTSGAPAAPAAPAAMAAAPAAPAGAAPVGLQPGAPNVQAVLADLVSKHGNPHVPNSLGARVCALADAGGSPIAGMNHLVTCDPLFAAIFANFHLENLAPGSRKVTPPVATHTVGGIPPLPAAPPAPPPAPPTPAPAPPAGGTAPGGLGMKLNWTQSFAGTILSAPSNFMPGKDWETVQNPDQSVGGYIIRLGGQLLTRRSDNRPVVSQSPAGAQFIAQAIEHNPSAQQQVYYFGGAAGAPAAPPAPAAPAAPTAPAAAPVAAALHGNWRTNGSGDVYMIDPAGDHWEVTQGSQLQKWVFLKNGSTHGGGYATQHDAQVAAEAAASPAPAAPAPAPAAPLPWRPVGKGMAAASARYAGATWRIVSQATHFEAVLIGAGQGNGELWDSTTAAPARFTNAGDAALAAEDHDAANPHSRYGLGASLAKAAVPPPAAPVGESTVGTINRTPRKRSHRDRVETELASPVALTVPTPAAPPAPPAPPAASVGPTFAGGVPVPINRIARSRMGRPVRVSGLMFRKALNGGGGLLPRHMTDGMGGQWVIKGQPGKDAVTANEIDANLAYEAAGVPVLAVSEFSEGGTLYCCAPFVGAAQDFFSTMAPGDPAQSEFAKGFAADALFANWDVVKNRNTLVRASALAKALGSPGPQVLRVDNGGALEYAAKGILKNAHRGEGAWSAYPVELWTLRDPAVARGRETAYAGLGWEAITQQMAALVQRADAIVKALRSPGCQQVVTERLQVMQYLLETTSGLRAQGVSWARCDEVCRQDVERLKAAAHLP